MDKDPIYNTKTSVLEDFRLIERLLIQRATPYTSFLYEKRAEKGSGTSKWKRLPNTSFYSAQSLRRRTFSRSDRRWIPSKSQPTGTLMQISSVSSHAQVKIRLRWLVYLFKAGSPIT